MRSADDNETGDILLPWRIQFIPREIPGNETESIVHYEVIWESNYTMGGIRVSGTVPSPRLGTWKGAIRSCHLNKSTEDPFLSPFPFWLYALRLSCIAGDFHPTMARIRLELLVGAIRHFDDTEGLLNDFRQEVFSGWEYEPKADETFWDWHRIMSPVTKNL